MLSLLVPLFLGSLLLALVRPRYAFTLLTIVGLGQDVVRKLLPGEPVWVMTLVWLVFLAALAGSAQRGMLSAWSRSVWGVASRDPARFLLFFVAVGTVIAVIRTRQPMIGAIGLASYLGPAGAVLLGYVYGKSPSRAVSGLRFYCAAVGVMGFGIYLNTLGFDWTVLRSVGPGLIVYSEKGATLLPSGFFRASETASWHCATAACLVLVLGVVRRRSWFGIAATIGAFVYFCGAVVLAGRRKGLGEILVFALLYTFAVLFTQRSLGRLGAVYAGILLLGSLLLQWQLVFDEGEGQLAAMKRRTATFTGSPSARLIDGIVSLPEMVRRYGFFGLGVGLLAQGGQHFGGDAALGIVSEGGVARVAGELGIPGLAGSAWLVLILGRTLVRRIRRAAILRRAEAYYVLGLLALLVTNGVVFVTAHQVFGDPFVYLVLGLLCGVQLSAAETVDTMLRQRAAGDERRERIRSVSSVSDELTAAG
jgi:hypothetical protein